MTRSSIFRTIFSGLLLVGAAQAQPAAQPTAEAAAKAYCAAFEGARTYEDAAKALFGYVPLDRFYAYNVDINFVTQRYGLVGCKSNLKNLATACEMYATDWSGHYPKTLAELTPLYLTELPVCPVAKKDTYSATYQLGLKAPMNDDGYEDYFYLCCQGDHHASKGLPADSPAWSAIIGMVRGEAEGPAEGPIPVERTCRVVSVQPVPDRPSNAVADVAETVRPVPGEAPLSYKSQLRVTRYRDGWVVTGCDLTPDEQEVKTRVIANKLLKFAYVNSLPENAQILSPLEQLMVLDDLSDERALSTVVLDTITYEAVAKAESLVSQMASSAADYYERNGRWPSTPAEGLPQDFLLAFPGAEKAIFTQLDGGQRLEVVMSGEGFPNFSIPKDYPRIQVSRAGQTRVIYRPDTE